MKTFFKFLILFSAFTASAQRTMLGNFHNASPNDILLEVAYVNENPLGKILLKSGTKTVFQFNIPEFSGGLVFSPTHFSETVPDLHEDFPPEKLLVFNFYVMDDADDVPMVVFWSFFNSTVSASSVNLDWFGSMLVEDVPIFDTAVETTAESSLQVQSVVTGMTWGLVIAGAWLAVWAVLRGLNPSLEHFK